MQVERAHVPSLDVFKKSYIKTNTPVVLTGVTSKWPALARWKDVDYLSGLIGGRKLPAKYSQSGRFTNDVELREIRFDRFIDTLRQVRPGLERYYLSDVQIARLLPELLIDIGEPSYFRPFDSEWRGHFRGLFFGRDTRSPIHHHINNMALTAQIVGEKHVKLYPPAQSSLMYSPIFSAASPVEPSNLDVNKYPRFAKSTAFECTLVPGDLLFIPVHWWHYVESPGISLAVLFTDNAPLTSWTFPRPGLESIPMTLWSIMRRVRNQGKYRTLASPDR